MGLRQARLALGVAMAGVFAVGQAAGLRATPLSAPGVIVFSGKLLPKPLVLSDWDENQQLMMATTHHVALSDSSLAHRPKIDVAMYWGAMWGKYAATPESLAMLPRLREGQHGAYYPAMRGTPAVWVFGPFGVSGASTRSIGDDGIAILRAHHLPISIK
jgi:hypothetical protein